MSNLDEMTSHALSVIMQTTGITANEAKKRKGKKEKQLTPEE